MVGFRVGAESGVLVVRWYKRLFGTKPIEETRQVTVPPEIQSIRNEKRRMESAAKVDGKHYTAHVEHVKQLKRDGKNQEAIRLLLRLVDAVEAEARTAVGQWSIAPWHYQQLAIVYRKERQYEDEVAILERYRKVAKPSKGDKLVERLSKARELQAKRDGHRSKA
jgi:hypothetical protein